eukprot:364988-Chlamydomonas_euryale.AAC.1
MERLRAAAGRPLRVLDLGCGDADYLCRMLKVGCPGNQVRAVRCACSTGCVGCGDADHRCRMLKVGQCLCASIRRAHTWQCRWMFGKGV